MIAAEREMQDETRSDAMRTAAGFAVIALAAMLQRHLVMANPDVAWLLTVAEKWLDGSRLYVDVLETNPPASVWLYVPFVQLARLTSLRAETLVDIVFIAAAALSAFSVGIWTGVGDGRGSFLTGASNSGRQAEDRGLAASRA